MPDYVTWLCRSGLAERQEIVGIGEDEIATIEKSSGLPLPETYKDFLRQCGRSAGLFGRDIDICYPTFLHLRDEFSEVAKEFGIDFTPPTDAFFFSAYQGGSFHYFLCNRDDPAVYVLNDGQNEPFLVGQAFTAFIKQSISSYQDAFYKDPDKSWMK